MRSLSSKKIVVRLCMIAILVAILFWLSAFALCEMLTLHHGSEFEYLWQDHTMLSEPQQLKVLEYAETTARVYLYNSEGGDVVSFSRSSPASPWTFEAWETIWSRTGSADGFVWPYIR